MVESQTAWRCTLCGYVHNGENPPDFCPVCGAPSSDFEPFNDAPSKPEKQTAGKWHCLNCNYIHDGDSAPDACPVCAAGPDRFEPAHDVDMTANPSGASIKVVIAGGGIAGVSAAEAVRDSSPESTITLVSKEPCIPYYRLNLTRYLAGEIDAASLPIHPQSWYKEKNINLVTDVNIDEISRDAQTVVLSNGDKLEYDKLILTIGSHPFVPPIEGNDLDGVFTLRTAADADAIIDQIDSDKSCVCIGGGILGLETAGALAKRGADVTLLETHDWMMPRQLTAEAAAILEAHANGIGIKVMKAASTQSLAGVDGKVSEVVLQSDERISCGTVLICTGVRPNTHIARKAELEVNRGVVVDNHLRTTDPNIYAAGDVTEHNGVVYGVWSPSQYQGTIAGLNALGTDTAFGGMPRSNALKVLGLEMLSIGQFTPEDGSYQVIQEQDDKIFRYFVFRDGKLVGSILLGDTEPSARIKQAIEGKRDFSKLLRDHADCASIIQNL